MEKITHRQIVVYREAMLKGQEGNCALCGEAIIDDAVLDHCHKTGKLRAVLHRGCNAMLGKIENNMPRNRMGIKRLETFAKNLCEYMTMDYPSVIHPTFKTKEEKLQCTRKKARRKKATVRRKSSI
jgi:hypothetical protein